MNELTLKNDDTLYAKLTALENDITNVSLHNIQIAIDAGHYSGPEIRALLEFEKLNQTGSLDLLQILIRGKIIAEIEKYKLYTQHPQRYSSAKEALKVEAGLSTSQYSNIKDLYTIIFPFIENNLNMSLAEFWYGTQWANIRDIIPYLKAVITGTSSNRESVNETVDRFTEDILLLSLEEEMEEHELQNAVAVALIDHASNSESNAILRETLRPNRTPNALGIIAKRNGDSYLIAELSEDQLHRLMNTVRMFDFQYVNLENELLDTVPTIKKLLGGKDGKLGATTGGNSNT